MKSEHFTLDIGVEKGELPMELTIKGASEKTGIPADTLRYYDKETLIFR